MYGIPFFVFVGLFLLSLKFRGSATTVTINTVTAVFIPIFVASFSFLFLFDIFDAALEQVTDPAKYKRVMRLGDHSLTNHFPNDIPEDAEFFYCPAFLQGGEIYYVSYNADSKAIEKYLKQH